MHKVFGYLFLVDSLVEICSEVTANPVIGYVTKPLLMVLLILYYATGLLTPPHKSHKLMIAAFVFSWVGDVSLMLVNFEPLLFLVGLVAFLITHVLYIVAFTHVSHSSPPVLPRKFWLLTPLALYLAVLLYILIPGMQHNPDVRIQGLLIPVLVYTSVISTMVVFAVNRYRRVNDASFALVLGGALLFMVSDSLIAINRFVSPFQGAGIFIMLLYISGQYLIARGSLQQYAHKE